MTSDQIKLLELLSDINKFKTKCKKLNTPPSIFKLLKELTAETADWGIENLVEKEDKELERR